MTAVGIGHRLPSPVKEVIRKNRPHNKHAARRGQATLAIQKHRCLKAGIDITIGFG